MCSSLYSSWPSSSKFGSASSESSCRREWTVGTGEVRKQTHRLPSPAPPPAGNPQCPQTFPDLTVYRNHGPKLKNLPLAKTFRSHAPLPPPCSGTS